MPTMMPCRGKLRPVLDRHRSLEGLEALLWVAKQRASRLLFVAVLVPGAPWLTACDGDAAVSPEVDASPYEESDGVSTEAVSDDVRATDDQTTDQSVATDDETDDGASTDESEVGDSDDSPAPTETDGIEVPGPMDAGSVTDDVVDAGSAGIDEPPDSGVGSEDDTGCQGCVCRADFSCDNGMVCGLRDVCVGTEWAPDAPLDGFHPDRALLWGEGQWQ